jgi:YggT family protein
VIADIVSATATVLTIAIIARAIMSFFIRNPYNPLYEFLVSITEPILGPIRSVMPRGMMFDFSPMIAVFIIQIVAQAIISNL